MAAVSCWRIGPASDDVLKQVATWRYEPPYDFYNGDGKPVKNPGRFFGVHDGGSLAGFIYLEERADGVFYGLRMRPDLPRRGLGPDFARFGLHFVHRPFPGRQVLLDVAEFNVRAAKVYER